MTPEERRQRRRTRRPDKKCLDCQHTMFNEQWGEYKCKIKQRSIQDPNAQIDCADFKKNTTKK